MVYYDKRGAENTERTLEIAKKAAIGRGIKHIVVASTRGDTGVQAAQMMKDSGINLVVVGHSTGHREAGQQLMDMEKKKAMEDLGTKVCLGTDVLTSFPTAHRAKGRSSEESLIAAALRMFGAGTKVCVEIVAMATDANLIPVEDVIAVAGSAQGADTAVIIAANSTNQFFDIKVREILAKPRDF
jgi:hypothetical protein